MNVPNNARSASTRAEIKKAFITLLESRTPDAVTVQDVCKLSGVNRSTFYAHYSNIRDLLESLEADLYDEAAGSLMPSAADVSQLIGRKSMVRILRYIRENGTLYKICFSEQSGSKLISEFCEFVRSEFAIPALKKSRVFSPREYDFFFEFCKSGTLSVIRQWLESGCGATETEVAGLIEKILIRCLP